MKKVNIQMAREVGNFIIGMEERRGREMLVEGFKRSAPKNLAKLSVESYMVKFGLKTQEVDVFGVRPIAPFVVLRSTDEKNEVQVQDSSDNQRFGSDARR